jgi:signal transduction histidine kinase
MKPMSLKWRLTIPFGLALAVLTAVVVALAYDTFYELILDQTDRFLVSLGNSVSTIMIDPAFAENRAAHMPAVLAEDLPLDKRRQDDDADESPELAAYAWFGKLGKDAVQAGSESCLRALRELAREEVRPSDGQKRAFDATTPDGRFRVVWMAASVDGRPGNILIGRSTTALFEELHELLWGVALTSGIILAAVIVLSGALVVIGLRPVGKTAGRLAGVTTGNLGTVDLQVDTVPAELKPFVHTVRDMLDGLNESIQKQKTFVADAAHDLRTPLAVAKSTLQVALATDHSKTEYRQALEDATDDLRRMEHLVGELLTLAHLDEIDGKPHFQDVDLADLLRDVGASFEKQIAASSGELICDLADVHIQGGAEQLKRLFRNMVDNALRHGPAGGAIHVILRRKESMAEVCVKDQGGAIPPEKLANLFDRFYRVDASRTQSTGGSGLGLAIARAIVLRHGGEIDIQSEQNVGTRVTVLLPLARGAIS